MQFLNPQLVALYAAALSAVVAAVAYYGKVRHERLRSLRAVLYQVLRFRAATVAARTSIDAIPRAMAAAVGLALKTRDLTLPEEALNELRLGYARQLHDTRMDEFINECQSMIEPMGKALADLARDDPVFAHRLSMQGSLMNRTRFRNEVGDAASAAEIAAAGESSRQAESSVWDVQILALTFVANIAARRCGPMTWLRVRRELRIKHPPLDIATTATLLAPSLDPLVQAFIAKIESGASSGNPEPSEA